MNILNQISKNVKYLLNKAICGIVWLKILIYKIYKSELKQTTAP